MIKLGILHQKVGFVTCIVFAGCGGLAAQPQPNPFQVREAFPHRDRGAGMVETPEGSGKSSWTSFKATKGDLMYVTTLANVTVYSYPTGKRVGSIALAYANGECHDKVGNVFIAQGDSVFEYKHDGKNPVNTFTLSGYEAVNCTTDPRTGNLAVTWYSSSIGYVAVYAGASGTPTLYQYGSDYPRSGAYDNKGNLFVDGQPNYGSGFMLQELPSGADGFQVISLEQGIAPSGAVQWDGKYMAVQDLNANKIYRFSFSGTTARLKGTVTLVEDPSQYEPGLTWIEGNKVVEANIGIVHYQPIGYVDYFKYPEGGSAVKTITVGDDTAPCCETVSRAPR